MGYLFRGFFASANDGLIEAAKRRWPGADVRLIEKPSPVVGLRLPPAEPDNPEQYMMVVNCEDELPEWSKSFPNTTFVYLLADCFGGTCDYFGYVCKDGEKSEEIVEETDGALSRLLGYLGVRLSSSQYFPPFERDYPW